MSQQKKDEFNRAGLEDLMKRRFIVAPAFQIYQGVSGLYDYGPVGCAIKANLIALWRQHFVLAEDMLEVDCTALTPKIVLEASGHVERFNDLMVKDLKTGNCFRADHLLEDALKKLLANPKLEKEKEREYTITKNRAGDMKVEELSAALKTYNVKAPETNNDIGEPFTFNLMFGTSIGPTGLLPGFLRPETAQGIFVNFKRLLEYNGGRLPFAAAQIGNAYRNEIAPRSGLLRVREFTMAEIEHFVKPHDKNHPKFKNVADLKVNLLSQDSQEAGTDMVVTTFGEAVQNKIIANETLAYFLGRSLQFMHLAGVKPDKLRFRQHQKNEMAHYANDCWDAEILTSYGWVECAGHADRGCFDLTKHTEFSKTQLLYYEEFKTPQLVKVMKPTINKGLIGKTFTSEANNVINHLTKIASDFEVAKQIHSDLASNGSFPIEVNGKKHTVTKEMITLTEVEEKIHGESITPHVIEPSFGLGRIIYALLEHNYTVREGDAQRGFLTLPPIIAPTKVSVLPHKVKDHASLVPKLVEQLKEYGLSNKVDETSATIGKRYARTDEIGVPFGITIDDVTMTDSTVTLRERNTMKQIRIHTDEVALVLKKLCDNTITWSEVTQKYPLFESKESDE